MDLVSHLVISKFNIRYILVIYELALLSFLYA
jgi:hypothetical protein